MLGRPSIQIKRKWVSWRIVYIGSYWETWYFWSVNEVARALAERTKSCDKRLARWISFFHYTSDQRQYCHVGNTTQQCRLGLFQTLILQEIKKTRSSTSGGVLRIFGSHTFVPTSWMRKKQTFSFTQFYRIWNHFSRCRFTHRRYSRSHSLGFGYSSISFRTEQHRWTQGRVPEKPVADYQAKHAQPHPIQAHQRLSNQHWPHFIQHNAFWCQCYVVCLCWQWGGNQNEYQRSKSHNEACFTKPTELLWIGCLTESIWTPIFKSVTLTPNITSRDILTKGNCARD